MVDDSLPTRIAKYTYLAESAMDLKGKLADAQWRGNECSAMSKAYAWSPTFATGDFVVQVAQDWTPNDSRIPIILKPSQRLASLGAGDPYVPSNGTSMSSAGYYPASMTAGRTWRFYVHVTVSDEGFKTVRYFLYPQNIETCGAVCIACSKGPLDLAVPHPELVYSPLGTFGIGVTRYPPGYPMGEINRNTRGSIFFVVENRTDFGVLAGPTEVSLSELSKAMEYSEGNLNGVPTDVKERVAKANAYANAAAEAAVLLNTAKGLQAQVAKAINGSK